MVDGNAPNYDTHDVFETPEGVLRPYIRRTPGQELRLFSEIRRFRAFLSNAQGVPPLRQISELLPRRALEKDFFEFLKSDSGSAEMIRGEELSDLIGALGVRWTPPSGSVGAELIRRSAPNAAIEITPSNASKPSDDLTWYARRLSGSMSVVRILTGYGDDALGQAASWAFISAQTNNRLVFAATLVRALVVAKSDKMTVVRVLTEARRQGALAHRVVDENMSDLFREDLSQARERLKIRRPIWYQESVGVSD